jgi:hypothetical protein
MSSIETVARRFTLRLRFEQTKQAAQIAHSANANFAKSLKSGKMDDDRKIVG